MKTEDIQKWLASDPEVLDLVRSRIGMCSDGTWEEGEAPDAESGYANWPVWAGNPKKWVRQSKMKIDSKAYAEQSFGADADFIQKEFGVDVSNSIVRSFWLRGTDHVTILTYEKDEKIVLIDDLSD
jgi:hypothetical protein